MGGVGQTRNYREEESCPPRPRYYPSRVSFSPTPVPVSTAPMERYLSYFTGSDKKVRYTSVTVTSYSRLSVPRNYQKTTRSKQTKTLPPSRIYTPVLTEGGLFVQTILRVVSLSSIKGLKSRRVPVLFFTSTEMY